MAFVMPAKMSEHDIPMPSNAEVRKTKIEQGRFAVFRFSGVRTDNLEHDSLKSLHEWCAKIGEKPVQEQTPIFGYFDPPWTPGFARRNEVMLRLN